MKRDSKLNHHIMVVEDDSAMQELIRDFLESKGYRLSIYRSAFRALEVLNAISKGVMEPVNLVISDINMPQMDGFEFVKASQMAIPKVPIILITAFGSQSTQKAAINEGAAAYLNKPFSLNDLQNLVEMHSTH